MIPSPLHATPRDRRRLLAEAVASMADVIVAGRSRCPDVEELRDLAAMCDEMDLPQEAGRVRRWIPAVDEHA